MLDALSPAIALVAACATLGVSVVLLLATVRAPALEDEERQFPAPPPSPLIADPVEAP